MNLQDQPWDQLMMDEVQKSFQPFVPIYISPSPVATLLSFVVLQMM